MNTINWDNPTTFTGRNGMGKCSGIDLMKMNDGIIITPLTSKGMIANCDIVVPVEKIPNIIDALDAFTPDTTPEQQHEINRADLKELKDYYGGWDELRKVIYDIESDEAEASYDSFVEDFYGSDKPVTLDEKHQEAYKNKYNP